MLVWTGRVRFAPVLVFCYITRYSVFGDCVEGEFAAVLHTILSIFSTAESANISESDKFCTAATRCDESIFCVVFANTKPPVRAFFDGL